MLSHKRHAGESQVKAKPLAGVCSERVPRTQQPTAALMAHLSSDNRVRNSQIEPSKRENASNAPNPYLHSFVVFSSKSIVPADFSRMRNSLQGVSEQLLWPSAASAADV